MASRALLTFKSFFFHLAFHSPSFFFFQSFYSPSGEFWTLSFWETRSVFILSASLYFYNAVVTIAKSHVPTNVTIMLNVFQSIETSQIWIHDPMFLFLRKTSPYMHILIFSVSVAEEIRAPGFMFCLDKIKLYWSHYRRLYGQMQPKSE